MSHQPVRAYITLDHGQLHYRWSGSSDAPVLVLLHQAPGASVMFEEMMQALARRFYVLAPDLPGFGASDPLPGAPAATGIPALTAGVGSFLHALAVASCCVFGHHTGASVAAQLAHDFPGLVSALALSGPPLMSDEHREKLGRTELPVALLQDGSHLLEAWHRVRAKDPAASLALSQREVLAALAAGEQYAATPARVAQHDFAALLPAIACPTLVFAGDKDPLRGGVEATAEALPGGQSRPLIAGGTTYVCDRDPARVADLLETFFAGVVDPG